ncbi:hypothetical protein OF846_002297 [Rhodotorula toruloides]|nr:hypothetical protein OF846_002297 [Rhodotorula toruloides]
MPRNISTVQKTKKGAIICFTSSSGVKKDDYMNTALSELKKADPALKHNDAFKKAMEMWKAEQKGKAAK